MNDIDCPYCGKPQEINHDDGYGYEEDVKHNQQCDNCDKFFTYTTSISYYYESEKADCLNDGKHNYEKTHTYPNAFTMMECTICGDRRELTDSERKEFNIPTKESYFQSLKQTKN